MWHPQAEIEHDSIMQFPLRARLTCVVKMYEYSGTPLNGHS